MHMNKGQKNCITDVDGVKVGHQTLYKKLNDQETICTGVTAILPHSDDLFMKKVPAANYVMNGFGKTSGLIQVDELGLIESPIMLTNTFSVGPVLQGALTYMLSENEGIGDTESSINIVVGECNDSYLNSMRRQVVTPDHAIQAIRNATTAQAKEGAVGAGKGMVCFGYKGGIGTASRVVSFGKETYTVGCLVLTNFGKPEEATFANWQQTNVNPPDGSIMIVLATDAPLDSRQLKRLAKRCPIGLGRTGSQIDHGSGDIVIAFSTANQLKQNTNQSTETVRILRDDHPIMGQLFRAAIATTEEAIINSLLQAETTVGRMGRSIQKAPLSSIEDRNNFLYGK